MSVKPGKPGRACGFFKSVIVTGVQDGLEAAFLAEEQMRLWAGWTCGPSDRELS